MLRISGLILSLVSCAVTLLLFSRVQSLRLTGVASNNGSPPLCIHLDSGPESVSALSLVRRRYPDGDPSPIAEGGSALLIASDQRLTFVKGRNPDVTSTALDL